MYLFWSTSVFVQIPKYICPDCWVYLCKFQSFKVYLPRHHPQGLLAPLFTPSLLERFLLVWLEKKNCQRISCSFTLHTTLLLKEPFTVLHNLAHMFSWFNNAYICTLQTFLKCPTWSAFAKRTRHIFVRVLNCFEGSACDKTGTVCQPARSRGTPSTERATCLGPGDVGGSTKRCRHLRLDKSHWQTICYGVTASITDQKHQWKCKGHSMTAMEIPLWTCNDVLTCLQVYCNYFHLLIANWQLTKVKLRTYWVSVSGRR